MKRDFFKIAAANEATILSYEAYRSDAGCQVYSLKVRLKSGRELQYDDSYFVGEKDGKEKVLREFNRDTKNK